MKISRLAKINYARFNNFVWDNTLDTFSNEVNILFGWNGTGKTTFSNLMRMLEKNNVDSHCKFRIDTDLIELTETTNLNEISGSIKVFNEDYIEEILRENEKIPYIFYAGEEAITFEAEEKKLRDTIEEYSKLELPSKHDDIAQRTAVVIKEVSGINSVSKELVGAGTYAVYSKTDFEKRIANIQKEITEGKILSSDDLVRTDIEELKKQLSNAELLTKNERNISKIAKWLYENVDELNIVLGSKPTQEHSSRISNLNEVQKGWIGQGVKIHFGKEDTYKNCLFCNNNISNAQELIKHFSKQVVDAIDSVDAFKSEVENYSNSLAKLESLTLVQRNSVSYLRTILDKLIALLQEKRESISEESPGIVLDREKLLKLTQEIEVDIATIAYAIESHFVAQQFDNYMYEQSVYKAALVTKDRLKMEIDNLKEKVSTLRQKVKNTHEPAQALNNLFKTVFPYRKIQISDSEDSKGYILKRDGLNCSFNTLSEGEKNFIALAYFIYSINDSQNKLSSDGVVVIDDPVSSLDKQSIFQIFSIIVNEIKKNSDRQYFLLTHNLDFFSHLREHFRKTIDKDITRLFSFSATSKGCQINLIHPLLRDHRSDYYYVFDILNKHKDYCSEEDSYLVVNLLRRWLETFLEFKFSTSGDLKSTLELAYSIAKKNTQKHTNPFDANYLEMYRFINHGSHGFADMESIDDSILSGAKHRITEAFELVKIIDELHYKKLQSIVTS